MSRSRIPGHRGVIVLAALLIIVTIAAGAPYFLGWGAAVRPPLDAQPTSLTLPTGVTLAGLPTADVLEIIDGDTIRVRLNGTEAAVRYFGIDTPERGDKCYREATDRNETLVGKKVWLLEDTRTVDPNGRLLRYVFLEDGTSVDATLVAEGFALAWRQDGRYRNQIVALETSAEAAGRGCLWK